MPRTSPRTSLARGQAGIQNFARATKPGVTALDSAVDSKKPATSLAPSPSKKRKLNELENVDCSTRGKGGDATTTSDAGPGSLTPSKSLRISDLSLSTPRSGHYVSSARSARTLARAASTPSRRAAAAAAVISAPRRMEPARPARPPCVTDLLGLHSAFLKALTIHAAHQGSSAPAVLHEFLYSVERLWKKRKVVTKDIQRLLWIRDQCQEDVGAGYRLANYGLGRVCLETVAREGRTSRINETASQEIFETTVDGLWAKAVEAAAGDADRVDFVSTLGVSPVHESLTPFTAFRKGQQRLQDLKGGVIKMKTERLRAGPPQTQPQAKTPEATTARRTGLLDRIRDKALRQSKLPPPPTKEMLLRRAAAQRVEEVAGVLSLLRPAGYVGTGIKAMVAARRTPFRVEMIVQNVQDSVRNPISEKEVEVCLEILARPDIAGQWVELVTVNEIRSVVLKSYGDVSPKEIGAKVVELKIGSEGFPPIPEAST
ncbi:hypothetical protein BDV59DRAFT_203013 [Aspergillus ambiguus]|uniref:DNA replication factor Cdt1 C-terminal domain-containing protein n=1 Tax=Aspergillus ambiguus TaxID=176160 RepID=UPI003CCCC66C